VNLLAEQKLLQIARNVPEISGTMDLDLEIHNHSNNNLNVPDLSEH
jgi:hypothetical protein